MAFKLDKRPLQMIIIGHSEDVKPNANNLLDKYWFKINPSFAARLGKKCSLYPSLKLKYLLYGFSTPNLLLRMFVCSLECFLQKQFYILIQIFHNLQKFLRSGIAKIITFIISAITKLRSLVNLIYFSQRPHLRKS